MEFHRHDFYFTTLTAILRQRYISVPQKYRPLLSQVCQTVLLPFSPYLFYRPPTYRIHRPPLDRFRFDFQITVSLSRLHRAFNIDITTNTNANRSIREGISGRYSVILPFGLSVLLTKNLRSFISA